MLQVQISDAVGDPATVMIHADDTAATLAAVVSAGRLYALALPAVVEVLVPQVLDLVILECKVIRVIVALLKFIIIVISLRRHHIMLHHSFSHQKIILLFTFLI